MDNGWRPLNMEEEEKLNDELRELRNKVYNFNKNNLITNDVNVIKVAKTIGLELSHTEARWIIDTMKNKIDKYILYELEREYGHPISVDYKI